MPFVRQKIDPDWLPWVTKKDTALDFGIRDARSKLTPKTLDVMKEVLKDHPDILRVILRDNK
jgi:hypothetical protein